MRVLGVIPGRLQSSRLPGKLILSETGKPLIQHTWESAARAASLRDAATGQPRLLVATDSLEIAHCVRGFGGEVAMTGDHPSGTDRIAEVVRRAAPDADIIVNIQGDEPDIDPAAIDLVASLLIDNPAIDDVNVLRDPGCVKAVCAADGRALYFSRSPVPFSRDCPAEELIENGESPWKLHLGIYAYRRDFLLRLTQLPPSPLEQLEKLEQLRALELGATIRIAEVAHRSVGIDTPEDYARFVASRRAA
jgi:3-deoxy-manno-octulosonate cytidylyltransferase (CMP-KDO synthetase)